MKRTILAIASALILGAPAANAADMAVKAPPPPPAPVFSWTGFYIGGQGGGGWGNSSGTANTTQFCGAGVACLAAVPITPPIALQNTSMSGGFGGVTAGFNYQLDRVVLGIEGDWSAADINGSGACNPAAMAVFFGGGGVATGTCGTQLRDFGTVTGRLGVTWDRALLYVKGGGAWARYNYTGTSVVAGTAGPAANFNDDRSGYTIGVGLEYAFTPNWSAKIEYQHMGFDGRNIVYPYVNVPPFLAGVFNVTSNDSERVDIVRAGINYRFSWLGH
jgi:outer membrane immunogenic protein